MDQINQGGLLIERLHDNHKVALLRNMRLPLRMGGGEALVIVAREAGASVSGAAVAWLNGSNGMAVVRVKPDFRTCGIGTQLLDALEITLRTEGCVILRSRTAVPVETAEWLKKRGFSTTTTLPEYEIDLGMMAKKMEPLYCRVAPTIPEDVEVISYREAVARGCTDALISFEADTVRSSRGVIARQIRQASEGVVPAPVDLDLSCAVMRGEQLIALDRIGFKPLAGTWYTDAIAVAPEYRRGWAVILLRYTLFNRVVADGRCLLTRFRARDDHPDTRRFAEHYGARLVTTYALVNKKL